MLLVMPLKPLFAGAPQPVPSLLAQTEEQSSAPASPTARYDFGQRSVLDTSPITHTFVLRSQSTQILTIDRLQPSCRCTTAIVDGVKDEAPPFTLAPGTKVRVRVIISPGDALPGPFAKEVYVFADGEGVPVATLQMAGSLTAPVTFEPASLDFGRVAAKDARSRLVSVTVDKRLLSLRSAVLLHCDNPNIVLTRSPGGKMPAMANSPSVSETFMVTLSPKARKGRIRAILSVVPRASADPAFGTEAWGTASVTGEIVGGL